MGALLSGVEGLFIPVSDPGSSAKWYQEILGCSIVMEEPGATVIRLSDHSPTVLCLVRTDAKVPVAFPENGFGVDKFMNFLTEDIEELHKALTEQGVRVGDIGSEGTARFFTFLDPDGNRLGVCAS